MTAGSKPALAFPHFQQHLFKKREGVSPLKKIEIWKERPSCPSRLKIQAGRVKDKLIQLNTT